MTTALKSLVLAAAVLSTSGAMAQGFDTATSKCGPTEKCINLAELQQGGTGGNANANTSVNTAVMQPGVVNLSDCLVKGKFNQVCVAAKLKEVEASLKPYSKCDFKQGQAATAKCGFSFKQ